MSDHIAEMAKALVRIREGRAEVLTDPLITFCPLRSGLYGHRLEDRQTVAETLQSHIRDLGMYTTGRVLEMEEQAVSFGASELLMDAMQEGLIEAAVLVCDGAGTVVVDRPDVVQAIGAHQTGILETQPISEVQMGLQKRGCLLLDQNGGIDQAAGYRMGWEAGYKRIAVTISGPSFAQAQEIRSMGLGHPRILAVHTTGISSDAAHTLAQSCDLIWSCASSNIREIAGRNALLQMGLSIPVLAMTMEGKRLLLNRALHFSGRLVMHRAELPLIRADKQPRPLL